MSEQVVATPDSGTVARAVCAACRRPMQVRIGPYFTDEDGDQAIDVAPVYQALAMHRRHGCRA